MNLRRCPCLGSAIFYQHGRAALATTGLTLVVLCGELDLSAWGHRDCQCGCRHNQQRQLRKRRQLGGGSCNRRGGRLLERLHGRLSQSAIPCREPGHLIACQGIALLVLPAPGGEVSDAIVNTLTGDLYGIPAPAIVLALAGGLWLLLKHSRMGIWLYAVGTDQQASLLSGLNVRSTKLFAFIVGPMLRVGRLCLLCGDRLGRPTHQRFIPALHVCVRRDWRDLVERGTGGVFGTLAGAGILTVLQKMLFALGVADFYTNIFNGVIMILAIFFGQFSAFLARVQRLRKA